MSQNKRLGTTTSRRVNKPIRAALIPTALELADLGAVHAFVGISTAELGKKLGISQQAASKHLVDLEQEGYIEKSRQNRKTAVHFTKRGVESLLGLLSTLERGMGLPPPSLEFRGRLVGGLGEGGYYISREGYRRQFVHRLGIDPYRGTLNLSLLTSGDVLRRRHLATLPGIRIEGFRDAERSYGGLTCYPATVNGRLSAFVCVIDRTHHPETVLELIAPISIKQTLKLKDGDEVHVRVDLSQDSRTPAP